MTQINSISGDIKTLLSSIKEASKYTGISSSVICNSTKGKDDNKRGKKCLWKINK